MNKKIEVRIRKLRAEIKKHDLDYFLIPSKDEFQNEYLPEHLNRLKFISGFTGSNGIALISETDALFFTDSRYLLQAKAELSELFIVYNINDILEFLPKTKIGYDTKLHTPKNIKYYQKFNLVPCVNLIDLIWKEERAQAPISQTFNYPIKYAGESFDSKHSKIIEYLNSNNIDCLIITDPSNICWLLNIRANDVPYNPILLSYLIVLADGGLKLFSNIEKKIKTVECFALEEFDQHLNFLNNKKVQLDIDTASIYLVNKFDSPILEEDPCTLAKACKNKIEISQVKKVHVSDGIALVKFLYWIENNYQGKSELDIADKLLEFRTKNKSFIYPSFATIAGFAENGAIIHYSPNKNSNKIITNAGLLLLDSGGQYFGGTTDVTRVIPFGKVSNNQKLNFTLVLKGHIALANAKFVKNTNGAQLDILARYYLWQNRKDYAHGTGHGVGNCLSVHEGPQRISKYSDVPLIPGMTLSNEPGYYKQGEYGIRIENLMLVKELKSGYLEFETLTLSPIDNRLIKTNLLSEDEKKWLNNYHQKVYKKLSPFLNEKEKQWLQLKCKKL